MNTIFSCTKVRIFFRVLEYVRSNTSSYILSLNEECDQVPTFILTDPEYTA